MYLSCHTLSAPPSSHLWRQDVGAEAKSITSVVPSIPPIICADIVSVIYHITVGHGTDPKKTPQTE